MLETTAIAIYSISWPGHAHGTPGFSGGVVVSPADYDDGFIQAEETDRGLETARQADSGRAR